jgi:hypothetical protein
MIWADAVGELESLGYQVTVNGDKFKYAYHGQGNLPREKIASLLAILKAHKDKILRDPYFLIGQTFEEVNRAWEPGALAWAKGRTGFWKKMNSLEDKISEKALKRDIPALKEALGVYKSLLLGMVKEFRAREEQNSLFHLPPKAGKEK